VRSLHYFKTLAKPSVTVLRTEHTKRSSVSLSLGPRLLDLLKSHSQSMEVVVASSSVDAGIGCWEIQTGAEQHRYKSCASPPHGLVCVGQRFLASSQLRVPSSTSGSILYWSWSKVRGHRFSLYHVAHLFDDLPQQTIELSACFVCHCVSYICISGCTASSRS
jgi:hypothetical protein